MLWYILNKFPNMKIFYTISYNIPYSTFRLLKVIKQGFSSVGFANILFLPSGVTSLFIYLFIYLLFTLIHYSFVLFI